MITTAQARELAHGAVETALAAGALEAEALVFGNETALTRFANDRVHQNVANEDVQLQVRAVIGARIGVASTNRSSAVAPPTRSRSPALWRRSLTVSRSIGRPSRDMSSMVS